MDKRVSLRRVSNTLQREHLYLKNTLNTDVIESNILRCNGGIKYYFPAALCKNAKILCYEII